MTTLSKVNDLNMAAFLDVDTLKFMVGQVHHLDELISSAYYQNHDNESLMLFLDAVTDFAEKELYPYFREMDAVPARFSDGIIKTHAQIGKIIQEGAAMGLLLTPIEEKDGGLQAPYTLHTAAHAILEAANNHVPGYLGLTLGAAELIQHFGNETLRETYFQRMLSGEWCGTMCLTEPQAGSSLSDVMTMAYPVSDGSYRLKGQKIFISGGDHEHTSNIIHLVLARIEGSPAGTKGISLFVVPKYRQEGEEKWIRNDVTTAGDFQKLGQRGYCTTHLIFGEQEDCHGWLVGEANRGLAHMFQMMNGARIAVGRGAASIAMAAYQASLDYARERLQGRPINTTGRKDAEMDQVPIIEHPDVRRMLYLQKALAEGSMSLVVQTAYYLDRMKMAVEVAERSKYQLLLELLTPICKTFPSEKGIEVVNNGLQVLGGYGYCEDYILQQYYRDIRIFAIYEGTTGIQSIDLLGRKIPMQEGEAVRELVKEIKRTIDECKKTDQLVFCAEILENQLNKLVRITTHLQQFALQNDYERYLADATIYMDLFGIIAVGWQWLKMGLTAQKMKEQKTGIYSDTFYLSKIHTMEFYFKYEMPKTDSMINILENGKALTLPGPDYF